MRTTWPLIVAALLTCASACGPAAEDSAGVKSAFAAYKQALLDQDGETAAQVVDGETIGYYGEMRNLALHADAAAVRAATLMNRLTILMLRHRIDPDRLAAMDAPGLFRHAVEQGWIGREGITSLEPGEVEVDGDTARLLIRHRGRPSSMGFGFHREGGRWKISLVSIMGIGNTAMKAAIEKMGISENDFIFQTLESLSGRAVPETIWDPPRK